MIPFDLATRVRALLDNSIQQVSPTHQIPGNLPRFEAGQRILAQLISPLPDGTFRALIAGRTMTLALPEAARSGDALELIVTGQRGETVLARQAPAQSGQLPLPAGDASSGARAALSQTGQIISQLLTGRFGEPQPLPLARTPSLLPAGTPMPAVGELVQTLRQVVSHSGLFYESHLRQWSEGKLPLSALTQEPQGQQAPLPGAARPATPAPQTPNPASTPAQTAAGPAATPNPGLQQGQAPLTGVALGSQASADAASEAMRAEHAAATRTPAQTQAAARVAEPLMPLVHQQLEVLASQQMNWFGQIWPGAPLHWEITHPDRDGNGAQDDGEDDPAHAWRSTLRLQLPQMGDVTARLTLGAKGLSLEISGDDADSVARMRQASSALQQALQAGGIEVLSLQVRGDARA